VLRRATTILDGCDEHVAVPTIDGSTDWSVALGQVDVVVHCAARVHQVRERAADPLREYRTTNTEGTLNLARQAATAGVRRMVFLSSVKVNGESGRFSEGSRPAPVDPYGLSKWEAERGLMQIATSTGMEIVIIRPPLVYGPGVKANFQALAKLVARQLPLPFGLVRNRRSLVSLDNLTDFIVRCIAHPAAKNETFFVSDGEDLSTAELTRRLARAQGVQARLIPVPPVMLRAAAALVGKSAVGARVLGSLTVDITKARTLLQWEPPVPVDEGLRRATVPR
jgi:nucleoside-diphosphate-sugar epimerase